MQFLIAMLILPVLMLSAQSASAQQGKQAGFGADNMVRVVTRHGREAECFAPLAVNRIDGETVVMPTDEFLIEAGIHTVNGRATLDTSKCPVALDNLQIETEPDLELNFVRGFIYFIGYDYSSPDATQWQLVSWKIAEP